MDHQLVIGLSQSTGEVKERSEEWRRVARPEAQAPARARVPAAARDRDDPARVAVARAADREVPVVAREAAVPDPVPAAEEPMWTRPHGRIHPQTGTLWLQGSSRSWRRDTRDARP